MQKFVDGFHRELRREQPRAALLESVTALLRRTQSFGAELRPPSASLESVLRHLRHPDRDLEQAMECFFRAIWAFEFTEQDLPAIAEALVDHHTPECMLMGDFAGPTLEAYEATRAAERAAADALLPAAETAAHGLALATRRYQRLQAHVEALRADEKKVFIEARLKHAEAAIEKALLPFEADEEAVSAAEKAHADAAHGGPRALAEAARSLEVTRASLRTAKRALDEESQYEVSVKEEAEALRTELARRERARDAALASLRIAKRKAEESNGEDRSDSAPARGI